jgi:hypothetical protein
MCQGVAWTFVFTCRDQWNEGLFGNRSGEEKKSAALSFLEATLSIGDALSNRQITDEIKFRAGLGKMIDGAVDCLNASAWTKHRVLRRSRNFTSLRSAIPP